MDDITLRDWLALREPADTASRSQTLTRALAEALGAHDQLRVLDLATGTGSNIRYLLNRLPDRRQHWLAVDHSPTLLAQLPIGMASWGATHAFDVAAGTAGCVIRGPNVECQVETRQMDLGTLDAADVFANRHLVTASALLDLVSDAWLRAVATGCRSAGAAALFTITYNGRSTCSPTEPEDDLILDLFNRHQHTDKGLGGSAAGPDAVLSAVRTFADVGYRMLREPSDWTLAEEDAELQRQLIDGWAGAATEMAPDIGLTIADWRTRRLRHVDAGRSHIVVGHDDVAAWPSEWKA